MLKAVKPEIVKPSKPKFLISGKSGAGKTSFSLNFPHPYLIDTEGGATREQYMKKLSSSGGAYFGKEQGSQDFKIVIEEIKQLTTMKHGYQTLIIDSFTKLYQMAAAIAEEEVGSDLRQVVEHQRQPRHRSAHHYSELGDAKPYEYRPCACNSRNDWRSQSVQPRR